MIPGPLLGAAIGTGLAAEVEELEAEVGELRSQVEEAGGGDVGDLESRLEDLESEVSGIGVATSELCEEPDLFC